MRLLQYNFLILIFPLLIKDWSIWSSLYSFKKDYIACTIALLNSTFFRLLQTQLSKLPNLSLLDGRIPLFECMTPKAFKAYYPILHIQQLTTIFDSNNRLLNRYITPLSAINSSFYELESCLSSPSITINWIVTLDELGSPIFGKQLLVQAGCGTCSIVHWISPNCESLPAILLNLSPALLILFTTNERIRCDTSEVTTLFTWADIEDGVHFHYNRWDTVLDFSPVNAVESRR
ncbi:hypothetical protein RhiirC2_788823 [Rhizophagus irregularis]|uniref:Uncharacterized protein n=1 Tax=Rhizophagus irregularis TaxID=588596 RepID=A0A2N1MPI5_9GLOM|nr:hypothetical protein RhiirC2_788823 [Rhizophagus irregularis]